MRKIVLIISIVFISFIISAFQSKELSALKFEETIFDFNSIPHKIPVKHSFRYKNISQKPAIIRDVRTTCGCTIANFNRKPILPNQVGEIEVTYDAKEILPFNKTVMILLSTEKTPILLRIKGQVFK
ncbi:MULTISPECIES: DUF1573 domain-containing protein [Sphingobacterium]|uniref:DUF1573 domain-containing protein n=1 Tax=Sphingobacterium TaxID=28453 RepID=UPI00289A645A|nr:DUF1573 domain-containing protein [Sphingobacterium sp.]